MFNISSYIGDPENVSQIFADQCVHCCSPTVSQINVLSLSAPRVVTICSDILCINKGISDITAYAPDTYIITKQFAETFMRGNNNIHFRCDNKDEDGWSFMENSHVSMFSLIASNHDDPNLREKKLFVTIKKEKIRRLVQFDLLCQMNDIDLSYAYQVLHEQRRKYYMDQTATM